MPFLLQPPLLPEVPHRTRRPRKQGNKRKENPTPSRRLPVPCALPYSPGHLPAVPSTGSPGRGTLPAFWRHRLRVAVIPVPVCPHTEPSGTQTPARSSVGLQARGGSSPSRAGTASTGQRRLPKCLCVLLRVTIGVPISYKTFKPNNFSFHGFTRNVVPTEEMQPHLQTENFCHKNRAPPPSTCGAARSVDSGGSLTSQQLDAGTQPCALLPFPKWLPPAFYYN